ncbi:queuosine precursor transporter [uncultured Shewanella sp.]|uniref:queuosine precursor transporter n=1 Tax=uncultured Shewanella sp. TaxID=173975 RepID=UPI00263588C8|nr:queuosine precursor transporter [uncultured Shewanella sp.]
MSHVRLMILLALFMIIISAMTASTIVALKPVHFIVIFPFSNIIFALFTFPIIDGICEMYGKQLAYLISVLGIGSQAFFVIFIQLSIIAPGASIWHDQVHYQAILSKNYLVFVGSFVAFLVAQFADVYVFQKIKKAMRHRHLWLRCGVSSIIGQFIDSVIFINIVFYWASNKLTLVLGSFLSKSVLCLLAIPITYSIVYAIKKLDRYYRSR